LRAPAERYASALADVALAKGAAAEVQRHLAAFVQLFEESAGLRNFLVTPAVSRADKRAVIEKLLARVGQNIFVRNFLFLLAAHRRTPELPQILEAYEAELRARAGVVQAQISSVAELSETEKENLSRVLQRLTGKKIEALYQLDPAVIGGAVVRIGTTIYDGSVRQQLQRMREKLASE